MLLQAFARDGVGEVLIPAATLLARCFLLSAVFAVAVDRSVMIGRRTALVLLS